MRRYSDSKIKAMAKQHWTGSEATFEKAWRDGMRERVVEADTKDGAILQAVADDRYPTEKGRPWWHGLSLQAESDHYCRVDSACAQACVFFDPRMVARREERERAEAQKAEEREAAEKARRDEQEAKLRAKLQEDFKRAGGTSEEFEAAYPSIREEHLKRETLEGPAQREAQTARTW